MNIQKRINAFVKLGIIISFKKTYNYNKIDKNIINKKYFDLLNKAIKESYLHNRWFTEDNIRNAINAISESLSENNISKWANRYLKKLSEVNNPKIVGVVMAGNLPIVGFHDFFCVLMSGNKFLGKLSSKDKYLLPAIADILIKIEPKFNDYIKLTEDILNSFDAIIATGSDNTSRYFEYYFDKYPNIIRRNRNGIAVITGKETEKELEALGKDIFLYFGLGCRNVSKLFVPQDYNFNIFFKSIEKYKHIAEHYKYYNNYIYNKTIYIITKTKFFDNDFLLLKKEISISSPISVLYYEYYSDKKMLKKQLNLNSEKIQCIVTGDIFFDKAIPFGTSQSPQLWDYADEINTMDFLMKLP
jgi:hypothetical protein